MSTDPNAIAERVADKLNGVRNFRVHRDEAMWERTTYEIEVPNDITNDDEIEAYAVSKIDQDPDKYEVSSRILGSIPTFGVEYEIKPV